MRVREKYKLGAACWSYLYWIVIFKIFEKLVFINFQKCFS